MSKSIARVALAGAFAASAAIAQTVPEQVPAKRPDGSVVHPDAAGSGAAEQGSALRPDGSVVRPDAAGITRTAPDPITVRRPDGTVVHSRPDVQPPRSSPATDARAEERERMRQQAQQAAEERIERSRREREAAGSSPARQVAPTSGQ